MKETWGHEVTPRDYANYDNLISRIMTACRKKNGIKFLVAPYFRTIFGFFCLDIDEKNFLLPYHPK